MLSVKQVSEMTGVSRQTIHKWILRGDLPCYKLGKLYRFDEHEVQLFISQRKHRGATKNAEYRSKD